MTLKERLKSYASSGGAGACALVGLLFVHLFIAALVFLFCFEFWVPGAILISKAPSHDKDNGLYYAGFCLMMVAVAIAGCGFIGACDITAEGWYMWGVNIASWPGKCFGACQGWINGRFFSRDFDVAGWNAAVRERNRPRQGTGDAHIIVMPAEDGGSRVETQPQPVSTDSLTSPDNERPRPLGTVCTFPPAYSEGNTRVVPSAPHPSDPPPAYTPAASDVAPSAPPMFYDDDSDSSGCAADDSKGSFHSVV